MEKVGHLTIINPDGEPVHVASSVTMRIDCEKESQFKNPVTFKKENLFKNPVTITCSVEPRKEILEKIESMSQFYDDLCVQITDFLVFCLRNRIVPPLRGNITRAKLKKRDIKGILVCKVDPYSLCGIVQGGNAIMKDGHISRFDSLDDKVYKLIKIKY